ncbi:hypothetical protein N7462_000828 [Penicillium macrosclerotiorum]|uniref:uncharacterized protein n=1 Tax=Penicillium macrosclerotiorum TaxID=303699 RepID=UPI0025471402|nr:uncharacterized protein N7462_000828 [Penicillium macrosclerotiorum]KAJ5698823.1 hypothetical protein N7462_000828 [Penicillium macrosclerotiorum]
MSDSTLYLYTSLTAGSSHIVTATARIETILKANKLPFRAIDVATDEAARKLWGRRSKGKKLPGLVKYGNIVGDLEEIEEWNEFGELRMVVNGVQDLDGMPATSNPLPATETKEPEPAAPKPATIKIQSPPAKTEDKKDEQAVLALRQASSEAASKAKSKSDEKKQPTEESKEKPESESSSPPSTKVHRGSVAPELPDMAPDSPKGAKRPPLVPEVAAVSSANFHADNAEALGLVEHHRGSIIAGSDKAEHDKVVTEIRQSISSGQPAGSLDALRKEAAEMPQEESIEEKEVESSAEEAKEDEKKDSEEKDDSTEAKDQEPKKEEEPKKQEGSASTAAQDSRATETVTATE